MAFLKTIAKPRLRKERLKRGLTSEKFAKAVGYSFAGYNKAELGRNGLRPQKVEAILNFLNMEFDDLFYFDDGEELPTIQEHFKENE
jgi:transcriptional regulator with XRE-family HTH domain